MAWTLQQACIASGIDYPGCLAVQAAFLFCLPASEIQTSMSFVELREKRQAVCCCFDVILDTACIPAAHYCRRLASALSWSICDASCLQAPSAAGGLLLLISSGSVKQYR